MRRFQLKSICIYLGLGILSCSVASLFYFAPQGSPFFKKASKPVADAEPEVVSAQRSGKKAPAVAARQNSHFSSSYGLGVLLRPKSTAEVRDVFKDHAFRLSDVQRGGASVPRIYLSHFPEDWKRAKTEKDRQRLFVKMILPLILEENEYTLMARVRAIRLFSKINQGKTLRESDRAWLRHVAKEYRVRPFDEKALLARLDFVPPSLALAQAILETGFGHSQAAMNKNSIFGHMQTLTQVASYPSLRHSVVSYIRNLNRHPAYRAFHQARLQMRIKGQLPSGFILAKGLWAYSIRREAYIRDLQQLIQRYGLERYDTAYLEPTK
ncbi:MAG: glucosaminidase domain-containing protein [Alphaproteobacteria bacterium]